MSKGPKPNLLPAASELRAIEVFADLDEASLAEIHAALEARRLRARTTVPMARDFKGKIGFALTGQFRVLATSASGATVDMFDLAPGGMFNHSLAIMGYEPGDGVRLIADSPGILLLADRDTLMAIMDHTPRLARAIMRALAQLNLAYGARIFELAALDTRARLQAELIRIAEGARTQNGAAIVTNAPTHAAIGARMGISREAVTRHMRQLSGEGLIHLNRRTLEFPDLARLRALNRNAAHRFLFKPKGQ